MRIAMEIVGIVLLINGIGGLVSEGFGLLSNVADGSALTALQVAAVVVGAALVGGSLLGRKAEKSRQEAEESRRKGGKSGDSALDELGDAFLGDL